MLEWSYPIFKIWMTSKKTHIWGFEKKSPFGSFELKEMRNLYISVKKSCLIRAAIQGNPEKKSYDVKGKENCQIRSAWIKRVRSDPPAATDRSRMESIFVEKRKSLQTWEVRVFFAKRELGGETPTMVFKKYHVVEPTISFFRLRFSNNIRPLSCSPF